MAYRFNPFTKKFDYYESGFSGAWDDLTGKPISSPTDIDDAVAKRHTQGTDQTLDDGGSNEVSAAEVRSHIDDTNNPHGTTAEQVPTNQTGETVQDSLDEKELLANKSTATDLGGVSPSNTLYPSQAAAKAYADQLIGAANAVVYKGAIDASTNPNYPAADAGHLYVISVAGKIGGASGVDVESGDVILCNTDGTVSGDQATVGTFWHVIEKNQVGLVYGPTSAVDSNLSAFDGITGKLIKDSGLSSADVSGAVSHSQATGNAHDAVASDIPIEKVSGATYDDVQEAINSAMSTGRKSGGAITDAGGATVNVAAGTGFIRATDSNVAPILAFNWSASIGLSIPSDTVRYIGVIYNAGSPQVTVKTSDTWDLDTEFPLGIVVNEAGTLYILNNPFTTSDNQTNLIERFDSLSSVARDNRVGGLVLANTGTRNVTVSAGQLLSRMDEFVISAIDTSASSTFDAYYRNGSGGWTKQSAQTQWNNSQYDDGTGTLASLTLTFYTSRWFYLMTDGSLAMVYGQSQNTALGTILDDATPSTVPDRILKEGILIGRIIAQQGTNTPARVQSAFGTAFTAANVENHNELANIQGGAAGDYNHLTTAQVSALHTQNTDTGTNQTTYQIDNDATGPKLKNNSGVLEVRNEADNAYSNIKVQDIVVNNELSNGIDKTDIANLLDGGYQIILGNGVDVIPTGIQADIEVFADSTITEVTLLSTLSGSIVIDIWKDTYVNYAPTVADTITASAKPTLSNAIKSQDSTLTGWTKTLTKGDILRINVDSVTTCTQVTLSIKVRKR